jgi:hypothetical protein
MPDNLTVQISADTSKLRADLATAQKDVRDFTKELRKATDAANAGEIEKWSQSLDGAARRVRALNSELRKTGDIGEKATHKVELGIFRLGGELTQTTQKMQFLTEAAGSLAGGLTALLGLEFGRTLFANISALIAPMDDLRKRSASLKLDPSIVKAYGEAFAKAELPLADANASLSAFADTVAAAQKDAQTLGNNLVPTVSVMKGAEGAATQAASAMTVMRGQLRQGAVQAGAFVQTMRGPVIDGLNATGDVFERIGVKAKDFPKTAQGFLNFLQNVAARVVQLGNNINAVDLRDLMKEFKIDDAEAFLKLMKELNAESLKARAAKPGNLGPSEEDKARLREYNKAVADMGNEWTRTKQLVGATILPFVSLETRGLGNFTKGLTVEFGRIGTAVTGVFNDISKSEGFNTAIQSITGIVSTIFSPATYAELWASFTAWWAQAWPQLMPTLEQWARDATAIMQTYTAGVESLFSSMWDRIKSTAQSALDAIKAGIATASENAPITGGALLYASGGAVPGRGTGDIVPAMLTPGEYVLRRSAVDRLGLGLLNQLNGLRSPLMPRRGRTHFADGGLVGAAAGGGTPVHLHLGGQTFALSGGADVVSSLAHEARRYSLRSTGTKPSWYGGTPGGR